MYIILGPCERNLIDAEFRSYKGLQRRSFPMLNNDKEHQQLWEVHNEYMNHIVANNINDPFILDLELAKRLKQAYDIHDCEGAKFEILLYQEIGEFNSESYGYDVVAINEGNESMIVSFLLWKKRINRFERYRKYLNGYFLLGDLDVVSEFINEINEYYPTFKLRGILLSRVV